jgi:hypothetical protein
MYRVIIAFLLIIGVASAATFYVPDDYPTIQGAINACVDGDEVIVRPGRYYENIDFVGKAITVKSVQGARVTTIDGKQAWSVVTFKSGEALDSVLDGFTVTNGRTNNGGGVCCDHSSPTITNNIIMGNLAIGSSGWVGFGGGISCWEYSSPIISNNTIIVNIADQSGGGINCYFGSSPTITNNNISGNTAGGNGGGIICIAGTYPAITNNTITGNTAGGNGGGIYNLQSWPTTTNCILWGNLPNEFYNYNCNPGVTYSDVQGGFPGTGNIDADPLWADPANDDFHLTWDSPCRNTGDNNSVTEPYDFEGDPRIWDSTVDMGVDEFHAHLYHMGAVTPGSPIEVKVIGDPGVTPVTLALGSGIQDPPQSTPYGDLYLILPPIRTFNLGAIPSTGLLVYPGTVPTSWQAGDEYPFQALLGPLAPGSVLSNLLTLTVE